MGVSRMTTKFDLCRSINANNKINTTPKLVDLATLGGRSPADISSGHGHLLVLNSDGTLYGTGTQTLTKAINGTTIDSYNAFVLLRGVASELLGSETILTISGGYSASYATTNYGRILAWGSNSVRTKTTFNIQSHTNSAWFHNT
jgi:alpha-tubulin suppressor-like RCC1 family protein